MFRSRSQLFLVAQLLFIGIFAAKDITALHKQDDLAKLWIYLALFIVGGSRGYLAATINLGSKNGRTGGSENLTYLSP